MVGVNSLYDSFIKHLREQKEEQKKISVLQLSGKIEDFLVKEFVYHVYQKTQGKVFFALNFGSKSPRQQEIDICLIRRKSPYEIYGMIEAKYISNRQKFPYLASPATDLIKPILKSLKKQVHVFKESSHVGIDVNLLSKANIYGLVFASYVSEKKDKKEKKNFYKKVRDKASLENFRYRDHPKPYFDRIFDDVEVNFLGSTFYTTLRAGLWVST